LRASRSSRGTVLRRCRSWGVGDDQSSPFRPLDWRWRLAAVVKPRRVPAFDSTIQLTARYLVCQSAGESGSTENTEEFNGLESALGLMKGVSTLRTVVEANILARRTDDQVAAKTGIELKTVQWYEALFFNVRDRLHASDWIVATAIGNDRTPAAVLKRFAYFAGPHVLDAVQPYLVGIGTRAIDPALDAAIRNAVDVELLPEDNRTRRLLPRLMVMVQQLEQIKRKPGRVGLGTTISEGVGRAMLISHLARTGATLRSVAQKGPSHGLGESKRAGVLLPEHPRGPAGPEALLRPRGGRTHGCQHGGKDQSRTPRPTKPTYRRAG
jgi:hypothetical protein